jgi:hypothetical protein
MITLELVAAAGAVKQIEIREIEADLCTTQRKRSVNQFFHESTFPHQLSPPFEKRKPEKFSTITREEKERKIHFMPNRS